MTLLSSDSSFVQPAVSPFTSHVFCSAADNLKETEAVNWMTSKLYNARMIHWKAAAATTQAKNHINISIQIITTTTTDIKLHPAVEIFHSAHFVTSSTKPEVYNILQCRQRRTEPQPQRTSTKNMAKIRPVVPEICLQTHTHSDKLIAILCTPPGAQ